MNLKINLQTLNQLSIIYISLPLLIFLATWLKPHIAIITFALFIYIVYCGYFKNKGFNYKNLSNVKNAEEFKAFADELGYKAEDKKLSFLKDNTKFRDNKMLKKEILLLLD